MNRRELSSHDRYAILDRFEPCEIIESSTRETRHGVEGRLHVWGQMDGEGVDILITWGGALNVINLHCASLAPPQEAKLTPEQIAQAVCDALSCEA